jgi:hypothetical protein
MDLKLTFVFANLYVKGFTILNPPTVPSEGEVVNIDWEDFIEDKKDIEMIEEAGTCFIAHVSRHFKKECVEVSAMLFEEDEYFKRVLPTLRGEDNVDIQP